MAVVYPHTDGLIAHLPAVRAVVRAEAQTRAALARALLAAHRVSGRARIEVSRGRTDMVVSLVDPAALSIEFGHTDARTGRAVAGLYIMTRVGAS